MEEKENKWYKWTKRIIAGIGIFVVLIFGLATAIIFLYEDEIKEYAVKQLNTHLKTEVKVGDIELTLFQQFPAASLKFNNTFIPDLGDTVQPDTMLYAESLYLNFNFWDIIDGNYTIKELLAENSVVKLNIDKNGTENYNIWKTDTVNQDPNKFSFALEKVIFEKINLQYNNQITQQHYALSSPEIDLNGNFSESVYDLNTSSNLFIHHFESNSVNYISEKNASLNLVLNINTDSSRYSINQADFKVEDLTFDISGKYTNQNDSSYLNLLVKGKNIDLETAFSIFPKEYFEMLQKYNATGLLEFTTTIQGMISKENAPKVAADFSLLNGSLTEKTTGAHLNQLSFTGHFENQHKRNLEFISLKNIAGNLEGGKINGDLSVEDFIRPKVIADLKGNFELSQLSRFINNENIEELQGSIDFITDFSGEFNSSPNNPIKITRSNGTINLKRTSFKTKESHIRFSDINGKLILRKNDALISGLKGNILSTEFAADGIVKNIIPFLLMNEEQLIIETDFHSKNMDLNEIMVAEKSITKESAPLHFPERINFNLKAQIGKLIYNRYTAKNVKGIITLENKVMAGKNIQFLANKGSYIASTEIEELGNNQFSWTVEATANDIDIENFFYELENFGQNYLTNENLKGRAIVSLSMATILDGYMNIDPNKIYANASINLKKGELINQQSMRDIAEYFASNKFVSAAVDTKMLQKKLQNIKFSELSNDINIQKGIISIPRMTIQTNVMDLDISGNHGFDDNVDYHLNFRLNEVLKQKKSQEDFGPIQDDGLGVKLFLHMFGNLNDLQYELDKEERKMERKEAIEEEKKELKSILKEEFGLFKKDTSVQSIEKDKVKPTFEVEWDEFDETPEEVENIQKTKTQEETSPKDKNKGMSKFLKKLGIEEEEKKKVEMEIDG